MTPQNATWTARVHFPDSYPIDVFQLSFNFLCLLILYGIYLNGTHSPGGEGGGGQYFGRRETKDCPLTVIISLRIELSNRDAAWPCLYTVFPEITGYLVPCQQLVV
jgi:hypothetical protein